MAPVLLCPECGTKHPLDGVNGSAFPCSGCGRTLKVPKQAAGAVPPSAPIPPAVDPNGTRVLQVPKLPPEATVPPASPPPSSRSRRAAFDPVPGRWLRFALWFLAVPLAFIVVFVAAKLFGVLTSNQVEDVALATGWNRFVPIVRLLPFVALLTAGLVQGGVYGITRFRARRHVPPVAQRVQPPVDADVDDWQRAQSRDRADRQT